MKTKTKEHDSPTWGRNHTACWVNVTAECVTSRVAESLLLNSTHPEIWSLMLGLQMCRGGDVTVSLAIFYIQFVAKAFVEKCFFTFCDWLGEISV